MREDDSCDEIDIPPVAGPRRIEQVSHQLTSKLTSVSCVLNRRCNFHLGNSSVGCDPEPNLVTPMGHTVRGIEDPLRRGGEDITRIATRARAAIGAGARACACAFASAGPWPLPRTGGGKGTGTGTGTG